MMKKIILVILVIVALIAIAAGIVASQSGTIIRHAVEEFGPEITGTKVVLSDVNVSILSGSASIKNLVIGNPQGFKSESAVKVGEVAILLDVKSLFSDKISIRKILVEGAELTYELGKNGSNISALQRNIEERTAALAGSSSSSSETEDSSNTKLKIDDVFINGTKVNLVASLLGGKGTSASIPNIHLEDIGKDGDGASPADAAKKVFGAITKNVAGAVSKIVPTDQIKETVDKAVEEKIKGAGDKLRGLFDKKK
jgi:uncharacterized protein involved in outer membrane biogenesis